VFAGHRLIWVRRQGPRAKASRECHQSVDLTSACSSDFLTRVDLFFGLTRLECLVALISFLWPKLFSSPIDLHLPIWFPRLAGSSSFRLLHDFGICSVSLHCSVRSSLGSARSLSDWAGLCPIVIWLSLVSVRSCRVSVRSCRVSVRSSFCSASFFVWCVADPIHSVICYSGQVLSLISHVVFLAPFRVSGAFCSTVPRVDS
jgi:hypothetical protein